MPLSVVLVRTRCVPTEMAVFAESITRSYAAGPALGQAVDLRTTGVGTSRMYACNVM
jgi:hypothetical protein